MLGKNDQKIYASMCTLVNYSVDYKYIVVDVHVLRRVQDPGGLGEEAPFQPLSPGSDGAEPLA